MNPGGSIRRKLDNPKPFPPGIVLYSALLRIKQVVTREILHLQECGVCTLQVKRKPYMAAEDTSNNSLKRGDKNQNGNERQMYDMWQNSKKA
ncbi:MAG: hypothetical protein AYK19_22330 [Theionarchaea archaeon DG-70-1]|nr:MAG: hypothetical protein AYK19_22330 [Theionarchaea archaeon DG-70-1]